MKPWLGIDSATHQASVAVVTDVVAAEFSWHSGRNHTTQLTRAVASALEVAGATAPDIEGIAVAIGPGSYTGLRVGLSFAKGLGLVTGAAVYGVPTLHSIAAALSPSETRRDVPLHVVLRAGRGRLAAATYPVDPSGWPHPEQLRAWTLAEWLGGHQPPGLVAGELGADEASALRERGFQVASPAISVRRAALLVDLARRGLALPDDDLASLSPVYLGRGPE